MMNTTQAREISIEKVLQNLGYKSIKSNKNESWYLSPFRSEKSASFKLNLTINRWFDHGEQIGGNVIDFVIKKFDFDVSQALCYLGTVDTLSSFQKQIAGTYDVKKNNNGNKVVKIEYIQHIALKQYLASRNLTKALAIGSVKELHYKINEKQYFAIGFKNNSDGWELRSKYAKICIGKKDITLIENQSSSLKVFEGFFDYLSFLQISDDDSQNKSDYLILNSAALIVKNISLLNRYTRIELYLDNDSTGDKYTKMITDRYHHVWDERSTYSKYKDLNEYLCACKSTQ